MNYLQQTRRGIRLILLYKGTKFLEVQKIHFQQTGSESAFDILSQHFAESYQEGRVANSCGISCQLSKRAKIGFNKRLPVARNAGQKMHFAQSAGNEIMPCRQRRNNKAETICRGVIYNPESSLFCRKQTKTPSRPIIPLTRSGY